MSTREKNSIPLLATNWQKPNTRWWLRQQGLVVLPEPRWKNAALFREVLAPGDVQKSLDVALAAVISGFHWSPAAIYEGKEERNRTASQRNLGENCSHVTSCEAHQTILSFVFTKWNFKRINHESDSLLLSKVFVLWSPDSLRQYHVTHVGDIFGRNWHLPGQPRLNILARSWKSSTKYIKWFKKLLTWTHTTLIF